MVRKDYFQDERLVVEFPFPEMKQKDYFQDAEFPVWLMVQPVTLRLQLSLAQLEMLVQKIFLLRERLDQQRWLRKKDYRFSWRQFS
jgi:hypothetical protein